MPPIAGFVDVIKRAATKSALMLDDLVAFIRKNLAKHIGCPRQDPGIVALRGRIESIGADSIAMSVVSVTNRQELEDTWLGERVVVPRQFVSGFERRNFSKGRTALLTGGILVGSVALLSGISGGDLASGRLFGPETKR